MELYHQIIRRGLESGELTIAISDQAQQWAAVAASDMILDKETPVRK